MWLLFGFVVLSIAFLYYVLILLTKPLENLPPGPKGLPILGSLSYFNTSDMQGAHLALRQYGSVACLKLGCKYVVYLNDVDAVKEAFDKNGDIFSGRPKDLILATWTVKNRGVIWSEGERWKVLRRFTISSLRDFGMGKLSLEGKIHEEAHFLCEEIATRGGSAIHLAPLLASAASNITCSLVFGKRFEYSDPKFLHLMDIINEFFLSNPITHVVNFLPWTRYLPHMRKEFRKNEHLVRQLWGFVNTMIDEHIRSRILSEPPRDFLDAILDESKAEKETASLIEENILFTINQLFSAGAETTATTLEWAFLFMIVFPDVQLKVQCEIDRVVGDQRMPSFEDRQHMPYTEAVIMEIQRVANIALCSLPHATTENITFRGYFIPARTIVFANLTSLHRDSEYWQDPERFNPDRFLCADGSVNYKASSFMPFSTGRRVCLGESLAKRELFVFFTAVLQRFTVGLATGTCVNAAMLIKRVYGMTTHPSRYEICVTTRAHHAEQ